MHLISPEELAIPDGHARWIHSTSSANIASLLENGFQCRQGTLCGSAVLVSEMKQFIERLKEMRSPEADPRFRLDEEGFHAAIIIDLPDDISRYLNNPSNRKPDPPSGKEVRMGMGETGFYVAPEFIKAIYYGNGHMEMFNPPSPECVQKYRDLIAVAKVKQNVPNEAPKEPVRVVRPVGPGKCDVW